VTTLVVLVIVTALAFDFTNGFHDTANAMATSIATGALRPKVACPAPPPPARPAAPTRSATAWPAFCFLLCAAVVLYGLYLLIPQFH
jgi:hypothetical protein